MIVFDPFGDGVGVGPWFQSEQKARRLALLADQILQAVQRQIDAAVEEDHAGSKHADDAVCLAAQRQQPQ